MCDTQSRFKLDGLALDTLNNNVEKLISVFLWENCIIQFSEEWDLAMKRGPGY